MEAERSSHNLPSPSTIMPKYLCSYAHDIGCFTDFVVEAKSQAAALRQIKQALKEGKFENVDTEPVWENGISNERVYVQGPATEYSTGKTLEELTNGGFKVRRVPGQS